MWVLSDRRVFFQASVGLVGGIYGAGAMTVLRLLAQRVGLIDKMVPQVVQESMLGEAHHEHRPDTVRHAVNQLLHVGYGAAWGIVAAPMLADRRRGLGWGMALGLTTWAVGTAGLLTRHRTQTRGGWRLTVGAQAVNIAAHLVFGIAVQLVTQEPVSGRQSDAGPRVG
jgi:hypothetical protein